jgi:hypothetical protein
LKEKLSLFERCPNFNGVLREYVYAYNIGSYTFISSIIIIIIMHQELRVPMEVVRGRRRDTIPPVTINRRLRYQSSSKTFANWASEEIPPPPLQTPRLTPLLPQQSTPPRSSLVPPG